jgi:hypothetical protein
MDLVEKVTQKKVKIADEPAAAGDMALPGSGMDAAEADKNGLMIFGQGGGGGFSSYAGGGGLGYLFGRQGTDFGLNLTVLSGAATYTKTTDKSEVWVTQGSLNYWENTPSTETDAVTFTVVMLMPTVYFNWEEGRSAPYFELGMGFVGGAGADSQTKVPQLVPGATAATPKENLTLSLFGGGINLGVGYAWSNGLFIQADALGLVLAAQDNTGSTTLVALPMGTGKIGYLF